MTLTKRRERLSDGSYVFDACIARDKQVIFLPCVTEEDADLLMEKLRDAIQCHTGDFVYIREWTDL